MHNAVKYNRNPKIEISIRLHEVESEKRKLIQIEFLDNGIGIPSDLKEKIFQRTSTRGKSVSGMGIGLSLVKNIIDSYSGKIWVEDRIPGDESNGSRFIIQIPAH